jgi:hypothetical protein
LCASEKEEKERFFGKFLLCALLAGKFEVKKRKIFYKNFPTSWYEKKL